VQVRPGSRAALFWGHREVAELLGREPINLRVGAGLGDLELIRELVEAPQAGLPVVMEQERTLSAVTEPA
jgi:hypothetical protein